MRTYDTNALKNRVNALHDRHLNLLREQNEIGDLVDIATEAIREVEGRRNEIKEISERA
jgi:hypothetical protein